MANRKAGTAMSRRRRSNDLIRIEDAIKVMCRRVCHPGVFCPDAYCEEMWELLEDVERVDAVPVVRCKDCKWHEGKYLCRNTGNYGIGDDDFCSLAERKERDNDG